MCQQRPDPLPPATQFMAADVRVFGERDRRRPRMKQMVRIDAVHDIDVMPSLAERVGEPVDVHRVAAKAVGRIEGGEMKKAQRSFHFGAKETTI